MGEVLAYLLYIFLPLKLYSFLFYLFIFLHCFSPPASPWTCKFLSGEGERVYLSRCCVSLTHTPETQKSGFSFQKDIFWGKGRTTLISWSVKCVFANTWFTSNNTDLDGKQMCSLHYFFVVVTKRNAGENNAFHVR